MMDRLLFGLRFSMDYAVVKLVHASIAYLSGGLFFVRFWLFYFYPQSKNNKLLKILPHVIDTFLLGFAIYLLILLSLSPLAQSWIMAKIVALLAYIGLGAVAIKRQKIWAFCVAFLVYLYIVGVAHQHHIFSWWLGFSV